MAIFNRGKRTPKVNVRARPVAVNPRQASRIERHKIRIQRCQRAMAKSNNEAYKAKMQAAIRKHQAALIVLGVDADAPAPA